MSSGTLPRRHALTWALTDMLAVTGRNLRMYTRVPQLLVFSTIQPVMFVLLFTYVFGGAISTSMPGIPYIQFLLPGVFIQTVVFGSTQTGVGLADDLSRGIIDRFRSLPMARSAVLAGRTLSDTVRNLFVVSLMTAVGTMIGFRFQAGAGRALGALILAVLLGFAFSWISAFIGLAVRHTEAVQVAGFVWLFPLIFASSAFVPVQTMPGWLQAFARVSPITVAVDAVRALTSGGPVVTPVLQSLGWIVAILVVFVPLAVHRYRRAT